MEPANRRRRPSPVVRPRSSGDEGRRHGEPVHALARAQHRRQPLHAAQRHEAHRDACALAGGPLGGTVNYVRPDAGGHLLPPPHASGPRSACAARPRSSSPSADTRVAALLPALLPGRRDPDPRLQRAHRGPGRRAEPAPWAATSSSSSTPSTTSTSSGPLRFLFFFDAGQAYAEGEPITLKRAPHVHGRGAALHHAGAERAVPSHLRLEPQPRPLPAARPTFKFAVGTTF